MPRVLLGTGCPRSGELRVHALTLGDALARVRESEPWVDEPGVRVFLNGTEAVRLEGKDAPVGDEDAVLLARM